jgi:hypothetical protein
MMKMTLNKCEIDVVVDTMKAADSGKEIKIEIVDDDAIFREMYLNKTITD